MTSWLISLLAVLYHLHENGTLARVTEEAMTAVCRDEHKRGGYAGLLHLLRATDVQAGPRAIAILPVCLGRMPRAGKTGPRGDG